MKARGVIVAVLVLVSMVAGCRRGPQKAVVKQIVYPSPPAEDFEGLHAYAVGKNGYCVVGLYGDSVEYQSTTEKTITSACVSRDGRYLYLGFDDGVSIIDIAKAGAKKKVPIKAAPLLLLGNPQGDETFCLDSGRNLSVISPSGDVSAMEVDGVPGKALVTPDGAKIVVSVSFPPRSFVEVIDWVFKNVTKMIDIADVKDIAVTAYGIRMYCLSGSTAYVYDGRTFESIGKIEFNSPPGEIRMTPAGNKVYFVAGSKVCVVSGIKNSIDSEFDLPGKIVDMEFTPDGAYGYIVTDDPDSLFLLDAAIDSVILSRGVDETPRALALSPQCSEVYVATRSGSMMMFEVNKREFTSKVALGIDPFELMVNGSRISIQKEGQPPQLEVPVKQGIGVGLTIHISSNRDLGLADGLVAELKESGYPAYVSQSASPDGIRWYKIRVGVFTNREDADVIARAISEFEGFSSWVASDSIDRAILPELPASGRDMDGDGKPEAVYRLDPRHLVVYRIDRGVYGRVYETSKDQDTYLGEPKMQDIDSDGSPEAVTELLEEGKVSIIDFAGGLYSERTDSAQ